VSDLIGKFEALVHKDIATSGLEFADMLDQLAKVPEMAAMDGPKALAAAALLIRNEAGKTLVNSPSGSLFIEIGKLVAEVERLRAGKV